MVKRINKIKKFGVFEDFRWDHNIPDFNKHNIFYGWNYSGKTTISRLFRCFEMGEKHPDYLSAEFELEDDHNPSKKYTDKNLLVSPQIRVFNVDYVLKNLKWYSQENEGVEPIYFSIGKENIELQDKLENLQERKKNLNEEKTKLIEEKNNLENNLGIKLTNEARNITKILSLGRNYEKPQFRNDVDLIGKDFIKFIMDDDDEYERHFTTYKNMEQKDNVTLRVLPVLSFLNFKNKAKEIIERKVTAQKIIKELKDNEILNRWVDEGRELHSNKHKCSFCGNILPVDLFKKLDQHFSVGYEQLGKDLQVILADLENYKSTISSYVLPDKGNYYKEYALEYEKLYNEFSNYIKKYCGNIDKLSKQLDFKKTKPFDNHEFTEIIDNSDKIKSIFEEIIAVTEKHKNKTKNFEKEKNESRDKLVRHFSAQFIRDQKYFDILQEQNKITGKITENDTNLDKITNDINAVEQQLSETIKGAKKINEYIQQFFQHDGIRIEVTEDNRFRMTRDNTLAKNLSEGEKTAISLAYFIAGLGDKNTKLAETIVFLDDPVSSLDCNHLFNIYAFIKSKLAKCGQLFVSTHNLEFFNLMKDFLLGCKDKKGRMLYPKDKMTRLPCYLIEKQWNKTINQSTIIDLPKELKCYKSEYIYLFSVMLDFDKERDGSDFKLLYLLPNVERRFLEGYLGLRYPDGKPWIEKFERLVKDETQRDLVYKFVHEFSHNQSTIRSLKFPDAIECKRTIDIIFDGLRKNDKDHFDALCESCD